MAITRKCFLLALGLLAFGLSSVTYAAEIDTIDYTDNGNGYFFLPPDTSPLSSPYYRGKGQGWDWTHNAIAGASGATSITLNISAYDVDEPDEVDNIYAYDADTASQVLLGSLTGDTNVFSFTNFVLDSSLYDDVEAGLQVFMEIDTATSGLWLVTLAKSVISVDGASLPNPNPTVPEPASLLLMGLGLLGLGFGRKKLG